METTKQGTSHFLMYVKIRKLTYILSSSTVWYPLRTVVRKYEAKMTWLKSELLEKAMFYKRDFELTNAKNTAATVVTST